jgi:hypothetical protein
MDVSKVDDDDSNASKFSAYQLPGGTNYREVLVRLPLNMAPIEMRTVYQLFENGELVSLGDEIAQSRWLNQNPSADIRTIKRETQDSRVKRQEAGTFISSHWDESNVLVHLRLNDRVEVEEIERKRIVRHTEGGRPWRVFAEGADQHQASYATQAEADADVAEYPTSTDRIRKRTLFVEEVQSDWGQQGREKGFVLSPHLLKQLAVGLNLG